MSFASNLLCLEIGEGLLSLVAEAETKARETIHQAEEELEGAHAVVCFQHACCVVCILWETLCSDHEWCMTVCAFSRVCLCDLCIHT